jgi:hypothetical protein
MKTLLPALLCLIFAFSPAIAQNETDTGWPLEERCLGEPTPPPEGWTFPGAILMTGHYGIHAVSADFPTPYVVAFIPNVPRYGAERINSVLSPDNRWLATTNATVLSSGLSVNVSIYEIVVYSMVTTGETYTVPWATSLDGYSYTPRWINNQQLLYTSPGTDTIYEYLPEETYLINPFTQQVESYEIITMNPFRKSSFFNAPDWQRAIYDARWFDEGWDATADWGIYDFMAGDKLASLPLSVKSPIIEWSPDSIQFVLENELEGDDKLITQLDLFDNDGNSLETMVTLLDDQRVRQGFGLHDNFRWSPDGRYLAFITTTLNFPTVISLYVADMQEKRIYSTCIEPADGLAWSPDGKMLAVIDFYDYQRRRPVMVLDVDDWALHTVAHHDSGVIGWRAD